MTGVCPPSPPQVLRIKNFLSNSSLQHPQTKCDVLKTVNDRNIFFFIRAGEHHLPQHNYPPQEAQSELVDRAAQYA